MPKAARGRRIKKRGIEGEADNIDLDTVDDLKVFDGENNTEHEPSKTEKEDESDANQFFGLVDRDELEYFKQAESTLNSNAFGSDEERLGFISSVVEEMSGKELKVVTSQICSKLVERIILSGTEAHVRKIFKSFNGHFVSLSLHKYASHCIETLIVRCAPMVEKEILEGANIDEDEDAFVTAESMVLYILGELNLRALDLLAAHQYGSHVLRMLIVVLGGSEIPSNRTKSALRSKKSKFARKMISIGDREGSGEEYYGKSFQVPASFKQSLGELVRDITAGLDSKTARELSINKVSSPVMQLLMKSEADSKRRKNKELRLSSMVFTEGEGEEAYVEFLLSDAVGSHFFESVIESSLPIDTIERLYKSYMESRIAKLARREFGCFPIGAILKKFKSSRAIKIIDILVDDKDEDYPDALIKAVVEVSVKYSHRPAEVADSISSRKYGKNVLSTLNIDETLTNYKHGRVHSNPEDMQKSTFIQILIGASPRIKSSVIDFLTEMDKEKLLQFSKHPVFSHIIEGCLDPAVDTIRRRKLLNQLTTPGFTMELSCNAYGSHLVDKCWRFTYKLKHFRERIAEELVSSETKVKESRYGKQVWRNWSLDKYVRKRFEWWKIVKQEEDIIGEQLGEERSAVEKRQAPLQGKNERFNKFNKPDKLSKPYART